MLKTLAAAAALPLLLPVVLAGCTPEASTTDTAGEDAGKPTIALVMKDLGNEFFQTMATGAEDHQAAHADRYDLIVEGIPNETDLDRQVGIVNVLIAQGVDAIVIAPADSKALVQVVGKAQDEGIVVVNIDNKLDADKLASAERTVPFVGPDNRAGAKAVGDYLAGKLPEDAEVAILEGVPTAFNAQQRRAGFEDAMKEAGLTIVEVQSADWEMNKANQIAAGILTAHPELDAILASNDSMAIGAMAARRSAGREGEVLIVGFDNIAAANKAVRDEELLATADQHADQLAVFGIETALAVLGGQQPADRETPVDLVTFESMRSANAPVGNVAPATGTAE